MTRTADERDKILRGASHKCLCGAEVNFGQCYGATVRVCQSGDHVLIGEPVRIYLYVENPGDVIEAVARCWLCGGVDPNETVTVAREYAGGPTCDAYKAQVHTGCWQDIQP